MFLSVAVALTVLLLAYMFTVRRKDLPEAVAASPWQHLEGRKAAIYENLRDLQFEFRVGKLSDEDYQRTKKELQAELGRVMAEIDQMKSGTTPAPAAAAVAAAAPAPAPVEPLVTAYVCPHCGAKFATALKFCGECGKPMGVSA